MRGFLAKNCCKAAAFFIVFDMPVDAATFPDKPDARCLLYVALSRARKHLLLVVSRNNPSPLLII